MLSSGNTIFEFMKKEVDNGFKKEVLKILVNTFKFGK